MYRVSTPDRKEAINTEKIYLDKQFFKDLNKLSPNITRCKYCKTILRNKERKYCDDWCKEMYLYFYNPTHFCKTCGEPIEAIRRKRNVWY